MSSVFLHVKQDNFQILKKILKNFKKSPNRLTVAAVSFLKGFQGEVHEDVE